MFIIVLIAIFLFLFIVIAVGSLLFGGKDPYEEELRRMDYEDERRERRNWDRFWTIPA